MVGRPVNPKGRARPYSFSVPETELHQIQQLEAHADREGNSRSEMILKAIKEYNHRHKGENNQTSLESYGEGGSESLAVRENMLFHELKRLGELRFSELRKRMAGDLGYRGAELVHFCNMMAERLQGEGVRVWR